MFQFINISASLRLSSGTKHFRSTYFKYPHLIDYNLAAIAFWPSVFFLFIQSTLHQITVYSPKFYCILHSFQLKFMQNHRLFPICY